MLVRARVICKSLGTEVLYGVQNVLGALIFLRYVGTHRVQVVQQLGLEEIWAAFLKELMLQQLLGAGSGLGSLPKTLLIEIIEVPRERLACSLSVGGGVVGKTGWFLLDGQHQNAHWGELSIRGTLGGGGLFVGIEYQLIQNIN